MGVNYLPQKADFGFDASVSPRWQMVPVGKTRILNVSGAAGMTLRIADPTLLSASVKGGGAKLVLTLEGLKAGKTLVEWVPKSGAPLRSNSLEVSVKAEKRIRTAFHYVKDNAGHETARKQADLPALISSINAILTPQSNVSLESKSAGEVTVPQNLGPVVRFSSHLTGAPHNVPIAEHEWDDVTKFSDASADFNVFFVWEYEQDATPNVNNVRAGTIAGEKNCLADDVIKNTAETLAHETIHLLGIGPHSGNASHLISSGAVRTGRKISRDQANIINPSGT